jgi:hypothetical protein
MLAKVCSAAINGIDAYPVKVEVNAGYGDTLIVIVDLPDAAVKESRDPFMTALINSGFTFTFGRTTINLAPADVKKEGPSFDLPIAIGMVSASEQMESDQLDNFAIVGELALGGALRPVKGVLPIALRARKDGRVGLLWCRQRTRPRRRRFLACRPSRCGTCAKRSVFSKKRLRSYPLRWISPGFSTRTTTRKLISPRLRGRRTSSVPWKSRRRADTTSSNRGPYNHIGMQSSYQPELKALPHA